MRGDNDQARSVGAAIQSASNNSALSVRAYSRSISFDLVAAFLGLSCVSP